MESLVVIGFQAGDAGPVRAVSEAAQNAPLMLNRWV
jgi:hypothetical protein